MALQYLDETGQEVSLSAHDGQVLLIVNTASKCGLAPQLTGLEDIYQRYREKGLTLLAFPCRQFLLQEYVNHEQTTQFCMGTFGVNFPIMQRVSVRGKHQHPIFRWLIDATGGKDLAWNFTKFLVSRDRQTILRFEPKTDPSAMIEDIERMLDNDR